MDVSHQLTRSCPPATRRRPWAFGRQAQGFTLVELLVTISILLIILAFLLPVLATAREAARRAGCMNNLAQIGKGVTGFDTNQGSMPGWRMTLPGYTEISLQQVSWTIPILPYVDELDVFDWFRTYAAGVASLDDVRTKLLSRYACPTIVSETKTLAPLSYMGNGGTGAEVIRAGGTQYRGDGAFLDLVGNGVAPFVPPNYAATTQSLSMIGARDGTAATLLATERTGANSPLTPSWADAPLPAPLLANAVVTTHLILHPPALVGAATPPPEKRFVNPTPASMIAEPADYAFRYPSSRHPGGVSAVFCDGRTQFISDAIAPWVYCQILTTDRRTQSPRATAWEVYPVGALWPRYVFDQRDLQPKR